MLISNKTGLPLKIACILDAVSFEYIGYECNLTQLNIDNWEYVLSEETPDLLLVESAYSGSIQLFYQGGFDPVLSDILCMCKNRNIPTVYWSNELTGHFDFFKESARMFEYIFTTDCNNMQKYKELSNHNNVYLLPFAAQPKIHNPIEKNRNRFGEIALSCSPYDSNLHSYRTIDILEKLGHRYNMHIYDESGALFSEGPGDFLSTCSPYIKGYVPSNLHCKLYKRFDAILCSNSMNFAPRRLYEILACGTGIINLDPIFTEYMVPEAVNCFNTEYELNLVISQLLTNTLFKERLSLLGQREVFSKHTYRHRLETILEIAVPGYEKAPEPGVTILTPTIRQNCLENVFSNFDNQIYSRKEMIVILNNNSMDMKQWEKRASQYDNVKVYRLDEANTLGACLNYGTEKSRYEYVCNFDDDDYYGGNYVLDSLNAFKYANTEFIGKGSFHVYFEGSKVLAVTTPYKAYRYVGSIGGAIQFFKKSIFEKLIFDNITLGVDVDFCSRCRDMGIQMYSTDSFNFVYKRHSKSETNTWITTDDDILSYSESQRVTDDFISAVTI